MTAGTGIRHSEFNPSASEPVHLYQIWLLPAADGPDAQLRAKGVASRWRSQTSGGWSHRPTGAGGLLTIHQDARIYLANLEAGKTLDRELAEGRYAWLQVLRGAVTLEGQSLAAGDGAAISDVRQLRIAGNQPSELMLFDLA